VLIMLNNFVRRSLTFLMVFLVLGLVGALLDLLTGGQYGIRVTLVAGGRMASKRVRRWLAILSRGWLFSPVLFLAIVLSPVLFVFALVVYIVDSYRFYQVFYDEVGNRVVYPTSPITDEDIASSRGGGVTNWLKSVLGPQMSGILYQGEPLPENFKLISLVGKEALKSAQEQGWRKIQISGLTFLAPSLQSPDASLDEIGTI